MVASHAPLLWAWPATQAGALTGNQTGDLLVHRPSLNPLSLTIQGSLLSSGYNTLVLFKAKRPEFLRNIVIYPEPHNLRGAELWSLTLRLLFF